MAYHGLLLLRCTHDQAGRDTLRLACRAALNLLTREGLAQSLHGGHLFPLLVHSLQMLYQMCHLNCQNAIRR